MPMLAGDTCFPPGGGLSAEWQAHRPIGLWEAAVVGGWVVSRGHAQPRRGPGAPGPVGPHQTPSRSPWA